jgi:EAL domain-containing protein (putative c-di-GMP-specific phosphodiesterase class I)/CHASE2 domain-containing sensor protein
VPAQSPAPERLDAVRLNAPDGIRHRRRLERYAAAACALFIAAALFLTGSLEPLENQLIEMRAGLLDRAPTGQVAIVEIDAKSLSAISTWPWSRRYHAQLIKRLGAAGVSMTAFDVDFSARSDPASDAALSAALKEVQPVILPVFQQRSSDAASETRTIKSRPAAPFRTAWTGAVNIFPGRDGVVRDFPAAEMIHGQVQPSLAVLLSEDGSVGSRAFMPDWSIDARRIPRFSFVDVLNGLVPGAALRGKRVIVGATAIEVGDRYMIPRFGTVPGVVIQAMATESVLQHRAMSRSGFVPTLLGLVLTALLFAGRFERFGRSFPITAAGLIAMLILVPIGVQWRWPISVDTAPLIATAATGIALRILAEVRHRARLAAIRDPDTGLPNQRALRVILDQSAPAGITLTAAAIERFEAIRSAVTLSDISDLVTKAAGRIEQKLGVTVFRIGPDTLAWVSPMGADPERLCSNVAGEFKRSVLTAAGPIDVRWTFGFESMIVEGNDATIIERAMAAITDARTQGRSCQRFQGMTAGALRDLSMMGDLRRAIEHNELFVAYQPKLNLKSGRIDCAETLVRWRHPTEGLIPPDRFVPLAEETGVVRELTRFVLRQAIADSKSTSATGAGIDFSVNVSAADISQPDFADEVMSVLSESGLAASNLTLEITESAIIKSQDIAHQVLEQLRGQGVRLSIDDYGTGQSTLSYLKSLPLNELKIDKNFVTSLATSESDRIMVQSTIELAHQLGLKVVAEGAEDVETVRLLTELGCDYAQGYAVGKALLLEELCSLTVRPLSSAA